MLNQVYANVLNKPMLVPQGDVTSLGSAIFAFLAAGAFKTIEEAQDALCPPHRVVQPEPEARKSTRAVRALSQAVLRLRQQGRSRWRWRCAAGAAQDRRIKRGVP